jgi:hypothetical protein
VFIPSIVFPPSATFTIPKHTQHILTMVAVPWSENEDVSHHIILVPLRSIRKLADEIR